MKVIERIYQYIDFKGISRADFERKNLISNGYLAKMHRRKADVGEGIMTQILENSPDLSPGWLLTGEGSMRRENEIKSPQRRILVGQGVNGDIHNNGVGDVNVSGVVTGASNTEKAGTSKETCNTHETKIELLTKENQAQAMMIEELKSQIRSKDSTIEWLKQKCDEEAAHNRSLVNELLGKSKV